jgi:LysR family nitrogen assimilation transcriptional regulator
MDLRQLQYFVQVASLGGFNRAAEVLRIAQPALSRQIRLLEQELGVCLLERTSRGVTTTEAGDVLLARATNVLESIKEIRTSLSGLASQQMNGSVSIGMSSSVSSLLALPLREAAAEKYPGITLKIFEGFSSLLHEWVRSGSIDLAVLYGAQQDAALRYEPVVRENIHLIVSPSSQEARLEQIATRELSSMTLILPHRPHIRRDVLDAAGITGYKTIEVDVHDLLVHYVVTGKGAAVMPLKSVETEVKAGIVSTVPICSPMLQQIMSLCWANGKENMRQAQAIRDLIRQLTRDLVANGTWPGILIEKSSPEDARIA